MINSQWPRKQSSKPRTKPCLNAIQYIVVNWEAILWTSTSVTSTIAIIRHMAYATLHKCVGHVLKLNMFVAMHIIVCHCGLYCRIQNLLVRLKLGAWCTANLIVMMLDKVPSRLRLGWNFILFFVTWPNTHSSSVLECGNVSTRRATSASFWNASELSPCLTVLR